MPLISVVIPTHNRAQYAVPTIRSVLRLSPEIEVVVSDTSVNDLITPEFACDPDCDRLRLVRPGRSLSVVDNFNTALSAATGEFLVFIGDDDFVSPAAIEVALWARQKEVDAIKFTFPVLYFWPDFQHHRRGDAYGGTLQISPFTGNISCHDAKKLLAEAIDDFGGGVGDMPRAYAGMVARSLIDKIQLKHGELFGGVSPDIYSATLISLEAAHCVKIDYPVIVPGASGASTAGQSAKRQHIGGLRNNSHIGAFKNLQWDERIPEFYSVPTVWSFSLLKAIEKARPDIRKVNFPRLYAKCFLYHRHYFAFTMSSLRQLAAQDGRVRVLAGLAIAFVHEAGWIAGKLWARIRGRLFKSAATVERGLADTVAANEYLVTYLKEMPVHFPSVTRVPF